MGKRKAKDFIVFDSSSVEVLIHQPCCSFAGRASNLNEHNDVCDDQSCDPAHYKQSAMDLTEASKGEPDGPREVVEPCMEEKRTLTSQGFGPSSILIL
jgi:hypothetical protein